MKDDLDLADIKFTFRCQKEWKDLQTTENDDVRFCSECNYHVHSIVDRLDLKKLDLGEECFAVTISQPNSQLITIMGGVKKSLPAYPPVQTFVFSCGYVSNLSESQLLTIKSLRYLEATLNMKNKKIKFTLRSSRVEELDRITHILEQENIIYSIE
jgi:hypothetical protein